MVKVNFHLNAENKTMIEFVKFMALKPASFSNYVSSEIIPD